MLMQDIVESVQRLSSQEIEKLIQKRQAEDKALRALWRAAVAREREERRHASEISNVAR